MHRPSFKGNAAGRSLLPEASDKSREGQEARVILQEE